MAECEAESRLHDFTDGSMAFLGCDLNVADHAGLNHHDPVYGLWWSGCDLAEHGHVRDEEGLREVSAAMITRGLLGREQVAQMKQKFVETGVFEYPEGWEG